MPHLRVMTRAAIVLFVLADQAAAEPSPAAAALCADARARHAQLLVEFSVGNDVDRAALAALARRLRRECAPAPAAAGARQQPNPSLDARPDGRPRLAKRP